MTLQHSWPSGQQARNIARVPQSLVSPQLMLKAAKYRKLRLARGENEPPVTGARYIVFHFALHGHDTTNLCTHFINAVSFGATFTADSHHLNIFCQQESSSQSSAGELSSSQVELNQNSKPPSLQSSCLSLSSAKVHPEVTSEDRSFTPVESPNSSDFAGSDSAEVRSGQRENVREVLAAARSEGSESEIPTYRIYAMSVRVAQLLHSSTHISQWSNLTTHAQLTQFRKRERERSMNSPSVKPNLKAVGLEVANIELWVVTFRKFMVKDWS